MEDRRKYKRVREKNVVAVTVLAAPEAPQLVNKTFFCHTTDLSVVGIRLHISSNVSVGARLVMRVAFSDPIRALKVSGQVQWSQRVDESPPYETGIELVDTPPDILATWREIVARKLSNALASPTAP